MKAGFLAVALAMIAGPGSAGASDAVYKWTDANGVTHFADAPPPGNVGKVDRVTVRGGVTSLTPAAPPPQTAKAADATGGAGGPMQDSPENRARICREARANLELLQSNYQVSMATGEDGKPQPLDEEQRKRELERAQDQVSFYCRQDKP
jgi:hypothetical protein